MLRLSALLFIAATVGLLASSAVAKTPIPTAPAGSGNEPTAGGGTVAGQNFKARYADVLLDVSFDQLQVYLFPKRVACSDVAFASAPYVEITVDTNGAPIRVGRPSVANGTAFVQVDFHPSKGGGDFAIQPGVSVTFTKVDPKHNALWHGRLTVKKQRFQGKQYSYNGTFAATWCGKN